VTLHGDLGKFKLFKKVSVIFFFFFLGGGGGFYFLFGGV